MKTVSGHEPESSGPRQSAACKEMPLCRQHARDVSCVPQPTVVTDLAGFTEPGKDEDKETIGKIKRIFQRFSKAQERSATREQAMRCQEDSKVSKDEEFLGNAK